MNKINFDREMQKIIDALYGKTKPKLLLHSCCAPCSTTCIERLKDFFDVTVYFYNPNLDTSEEFQLRANEQVRLAKELNVRCKVIDYNNEEFLLLAKGYENCLEGGSRCERCFRLRLDKTARQAKEGGYDFFATTLTLSPLKNCELINKIGKDLQEVYSVKYLPSDFKKNDGFLKSIRLSDKYGLYRQNYCGCKFSKKGK